MDMVKKLETWVPHAQTKDQRLLLVETWKYLQEYQALVLLPKTALTMEIQWIFFSRKIVAAATEWSRHCSMALLK
ncbi:hypothetical protein TNCV_169571 [Trichonephila clavipes]|nr:hypothetical protein TNCV_169571 [Trichonephila clavipes]